MMPYTFESVGRLEKIHNVTITILDCVIVVLGL